VPRCAATKGDGTPCQAIVRESQQLCHAHDPARADQRRRAASKAGKSRTGGELAEIKRQLKQAADDVIAGRLQTGRGSVAAQIYGVYIRAAEQERRQRELEELAGEIKELREVVEWSTASPTGNHDWGH